MTLPEPNRDFLQTTELPKEREHLSVVKKPDPIRRATAAHVTCLVVGAGLFLTGILGFMAPGMMGAHLGSIHNFIHLLTGAAAFWFGLSGSTKAVRLFALIFGGIYALLGIFGFVFGTPGVPMMASFTWDPFLLELIPGRFELGRMDHILHLMIGGILVSVAYFYPKTRALEIH